MSKTKVFVIMPFADDFFESYEMIKEHFSDDFEFSHAGEEDNQQNILADIIPPIYAADIVLADLTGLNPNVMYELGIAHSFNKKTIMITRDDLGSLPFDLKQYRAKDYSTHFKKFYDLIAYLEKNLQGARDGSVIFNNPVGDFMDRSKIAPEELFRKEIIRVDIPEGEMGFLDFLAEIEEDTENMTKDIQNISLEMQTMSGGINECTAEIKRVNKTGGSGTASFVRKQSRKAAEYIETFSKQLKAHNVTISSYWTKIEKNILGLLENDISARQENKESLVKYMKALLKMKDSIILSNESVQNLKETSLKNLGIERSMNQAIRFLDQDLSAYIDMTEQMINSIERIIGKSRFIIGDVSLSEDAVEN
jgi:nucleoside 2-deoxyribosyltransferase